MFAVFPGSGLGAAWPVWVGVYVLAVYSVFRGGGLGTAWPVGVGVYVFAVFCARWRGGGHCEFVGRGFHAVYSVSS